jgi:hypothetical protein
VALARANEPGGQFLMKSVMCALDNMAMLRKKGDARTPLTPNRFERNFCDRIFSVSRKLFECARVLASL